MIPVQAFKRPLFFAVIFAEITLTMGLAGCMQNRLFKKSNYFTASSLPVELAARPLQSAQVVDLSRFAGPPVDNKKIGDGDILGISLAAGLNADDIVEFDIRVGDGGETLFPEIGRLPLGGLDVTGAEKMIAAACIHRGLYRHPNVTVIMKEQRTNSITVVGAVEEPGVHELPRGSSNLMTAILAAGGTEEDAGTKIQIHRPSGPSILASDSNGQNTDNFHDNRSMVQQANNEVDPAAADASAPNASGVRQAGHDEPAMQRDAAQRGVELICLNLADPEDKSSKQASLGDGSIVTVERLRPAPIEVIGLVRKPGQYDYPVAHEMRLLNTIAQAGGVSSKQTDGVIVIRKLSDGSGFVGIKASLKKAKVNPAENLRIAPGDVISVEENLGTVIADAVNIVRFGVGASVPLF